MKLYYSPGACSLASHMIALEGGMPLELVKVDLKAHRTERGEDYAAINPKGYVPTLVLDNGETLTESAVVLQYLADQMPQAGLIPPAGSMARYRVQEWLNFVASELHKGFGPLWNANAVEPAKEAARAMLGKRYAWLDGQLAGISFLTGETFTVADAYAVTVLSWSGLHGIDLQPYPNLRAYVERVRARPRVQQALKEEGLI